MTIKQTIKKVFPFLYNIKMSVAIKQRYFQEYKLFYRNWIGSKVNINTAGYKIILNAHAIEKGMSNMKPRPFGVTKTAEIMSLIAKYEKKRWAKDYAYCLGISILSEYCNFYKKHQWTNTPEYQKASNFIKNRKSKLPSGAQEIRKNDIIKDAEINYAQFLSSRHSIRNFDKRSLNDTDIEQAISATTKTPTACNRQMVKIYYVYNKLKRQQVLQYAHGLTGFDNDTVNMFIITYDMSSLCNAGEVCQGYFNAGLVTMNFVNALHSKGIGSCLLEFGNNTKEERRLKNLLNIPQCERVAVILATGYYPNKAIVPVSARKPIDEVYKKVL